MQSLIARYFLNPSFVLPGAALVSVPIIIHFLNRLRYRRVRFAAMEFLLSSDKRNRRRVMIEQLILLALRCLIVILLVALIGRLVLDAAQLSLFRGARAHHLIILDDSGSMNDRWGETTAFDEAVKIARGLVDEGAQLPDTQRVSIMLMSQPEKLLVSERVVNEALLAEVATKLENLRCTARDLDPRLALEAVLRDDRSTVHQLHVVTDFRRQDWIAEPAIVDSIEALDRAGVSVNIARVVSEQHPNIGIVRLDRETSDPAVGVPVRFRVGIRNFGESLVRDVRLSVIVDGQRLPLTVQFDKAEPGKEITQTRDLTFDTAGPHSVEVALESDSLHTDDTRFATLDIAEANPVLIIDGDQEGGGARYVAAAIAADPTLTGYDTEVAQAQFLDTQPLDIYGCVYMLNVPVLGDDAREALQDYVNNGGAVIWFVGDLVDPGDYTEKLYAAGTGLFPVPLSDTVADLAAQDAPDVLFGSHPALAIFGIEEFQFAEALTIHKWFPVDGEWEPDDTVRQDRVRTLATLRNGAPFIFEHRYGAGRVFTFLTAIDRVWTNWPIGDANPSFVVMNLDLQRLLGQGADEATMRLVGEPIELSLPMTRYRETVEVMTPQAAGGQSIRITAAPPADRASDEDAPVELEAVYRETDQPGVYRIGLVDQDMIPENRWLAYNVSPAESELQLADPGELLRRLGDVEGLTIQAPGDLNWIQGHEIGHELRWILLITLVVVLMLEQFLGFRFSYHPRVAGLAT